MYTKAFVLKYFLILAVILIKTHQSSARIIRREECIQNTLSFGCDIERIHLNESIILNIFTRNPTKITHVWIQNSTVPILSKSVFQTFTHLKQLSAVGVGIGKLYPGFLRRTNRIETLDLRFNNLTKLSKLTFIGGTNLKDLLLFGNQISVIDPLAFINLRSLKNLYLGRNHLRAVDMKLFNNLVNLRTLSLEANYVKTLNIYSDVKGLKMLQELFLHGNRLKKLEVDQLLDQLPGLQVITVYDNVIPCGNLLEYVQKLRTRGVNVEQPRKVKFTFKDHHCLSQINKEVLRDNLI